MASWTEPYETEPLLRYGVATAMSLCSLIALCGMAAAEVPPQGWVVVALFFTFWLTFIWRIMLTGLYIGDKGVKVRMVHRTLVIPWSNVDRAWAGRATNYRAWAIWISTREPVKHVETPIWREGLPRYRHLHRLDFAEFARAIDRVNAEAARRDSA